MTNNKDTEAKQQVNHMENHEKKHEMTGKAVETTWKPKENQETHLES